MKNTRMPANLAPNTIRESNSFGSYIITKYTDCTDINIKFLETGTEITVNSEQIRTGKMKDPMKPVVYGKGYIGIGSHKSYRNNKKTRERNLWDNMLTRCYGKQYKHKGYKVCLQWLNFQTFCDDIQKLQNYSQWIKGNLFELDKDFRVTGNKIYSPDTCMFLHSDDNKVLGGRSGLGRKWKRSA